MTHFNPDDWERYKNYYFKNKETDKVIHEESYFAMESRKEVIDKEDVLRFETIEEILEEAEEAAEYAKEKGLLGEYDGIMSLVDELRSEMYE